MKMKTKAHESYKLANGEKVVGVTTVTNILAKPALIKWANNLGLQGIDSSRYVDDKADIGTLAHNMVMCYLSGAKVDTADYSANQIEQAEWACNSFFAWIKGHNIKLLESEKPLVSEVHKFGGKFDIYALLDDKRELIDLKTGSGIYDEHYTQVAGGYGLLMTENGYEMERVRILNIPRTNNENWCEVVVSDEQVDVHQELFLALLKVYNLKKQAKEKTIYPHKPKKGD